MIKHFKKKLILLALTAITLSGCGNSEKTIDISESELSKQIVSPVYVENVVGALSGDLNSNLSSTITSQTLTIEDESINKSEVIDISQNDFFVSIAPYENSTHPWENHILTGRKGEMVDKDFKVKIEDKEGNIVVDKKVNSGSNGFLDFWLPRNKKFNITIEYKNKSTNSMISTFDKDPTCITTIQL